ncbi:uncharacterized protein [Typha latifolia]|uniref:uncharacterized protein n=1 Tax=Typha latifolia TaxID=4733 RepID=UPI003C2D4272
MKDLSLFLVKNSLASKMKRGIRSFCNGVGSTSTLNQRKSDRVDVSCAAAPSVVDSCMEESNVTGSPLTLEEMILQLDLEEEAARVTRLDDYSNLHRRMSCVNNADILRSARNALNQYPRFSLDGKDAMYRSSFRNFGGRTSNYEGGRKSASCSRGRSIKDGYEVDLERTLRLPPTLAGQNVIWCKPGVVAKLMGLDALPVPVSDRNARRRVSPLVSRKHNLRRLGRHELEKERIYMTMHGYKPSSHSTMNPIEEEWRFRHAR